jgi:putative peptidoglycan lipid II flippase
LLADPLVKIAFQGGSFSATDAVMTARAVKAQCLGLWAISIYSLLTRAFIAQKDTKTSSYVGALSLCVNICLALCLMGPAKAQHSSWLYDRIGALQGLLVDNLGGLALGHVGLALAASFSSFFSLIVLSLLLLRKVRGLAWGIFIKSTLKAILACVPTFFAWNLLADHLGPSPWTLVLVGMPLILLGFLFFSFLLSSAELREIRLNVKKYLRRQLS